MAVVALIALDSMERQTSLSGSCVVVQGEIIESTAATEPLENPILDTLESAHFL